MATQDLVLTPFEPPAPLDKWHRLLELAVERGGGAEQFAMLVDAITKARREDARLQFEAALGRFRTHIPEILKTRKVSIATRGGENMEYWHAELDKAAKIIGEELQREGLIASWRPSEGDNGRTIVTCVFRHPVSGHVEDMATLGGPPDTSGGKNSIQAIGSTNTYLERYTLFAAAGIVPTGTDTDGVAPTGLPEDAITDYCIQMNDSITMAELQKVFKECYTKARDLKDDSAQKRLAKVYEQRKRELFQGGKP